MDRAETAAAFIESHCPRIGSFRGDSAPHRFLDDTASELADAPPTALFPQRYKEYVAYAIGQVARHYFSCPPAAVAAVYLATRFEFYFRIMSGVLNADGTWKDKANDQGPAIAALRTKGLKRNRVSDVAVTYKLMKHNHAQPAAALFAALDNDLFPVPMTAVGKFRLADIGDRIAFGRHAAGHGSWGDISSEAVFYGLVTAIIFYME